MKNAITAYIAPMAAGAIWLPKAHQRGVGLGLIDELEAEKALNFAPTAVNAASRTSKTQKQ